ncbi:HisA/HisF-related TIM barrel protein [Laspinema sp. D1]|uniref:imidazole glycerol-phosphate synthase n=1 Tax=Laspinema palackyanum D2a TaxID=2953684 RepID=A0ABT2MUV6_9CYAN|nr:HisA/HisF-related TIM barrel protein [Laspinema sp. D2a]
MLKKRIIFTLLYKNGFFMLSRNFRLQKVGNIEWLQKNYNFSRIAFSIDELIILDVSRDQRDTQEFCNCLQTLTEGCFIPIAAGGGIRTIEHAKNLLQSGADKVVLNSCIFNNPSLVQKISQEFGQQCIVASIDVKGSDKGYTIWTNHGSIPQDVSLANWSSNLANLPIGELYLNSMDRDGTGQGYDFGMLDHLPKSITVPLIIAGGAGKDQHLAEGLSDHRVDAVATAHLFNFVGDGLVKARQNLIRDGYDLPFWRFTLDV